MYRVVEKSFGNGNAIISKFVRRSKERAMNKKTKKYIIESIIIVVILAVLALSIFLYFKNIVITIAVLILLIIIGKKFIQIIARKNIYSMLYQDLDPKALLEVDSINNFSLHPMYKSMCQLNLGDYAQTVNICTYMIRNSKSDWARMSYFKILSETYFQLDDIELLKDTCDKIDSLIKDNPRHAAEFKTDFYRFYVDGQYDKCIESCKNRLAEIEGKSEEYNLARLNIYFRMAVSYFKSKDSENARKWFEEVIRFGPKMYVSEIAKQYLEKIENGDLSAIEFPKVIPDNNFDDNFKKQVYKAPKKLKVIKWAAVALIALGIVIEVISVFHPVIDLRSELDEIYDDYELLGRCDALYDGEIVDTFALVLVEDRIDLATLVYYDYGTDSYTKGIEIRIIDMQAYIDYVLTDIFDYSYITELSLIDGDKADDEEYLEKIEFKKDGKDMAFVIEDVYPVN